MVHEQSRCAIGKFGSPAAARRRFASAELDVSQDLAARPGALGSATLHEALEVLRAVLAGEVDVALANLLVAAEGRVLAHPPVRVGAVEIRIERRRRQRRLPVPERRDSRKHGLELAEERGRVRHDQGARGVRVWRRWTEGTGDVATRVVDEDASRAGLAARHVPRVLVAGIRIAAAVADPRPWPGPIPQARVELELELVVAAPAQVLDGRVLEIVEARPTV